MFELSFGEQLVRVGVDLACEDRASTYVVKYVLECRSVLECRGKVVELSFGERLVRVELNRRARNTPQLCTFGINSLHVFVPTQVQVGGCVLVFSGLPLAWKGES